MSPSSAELPVPGLQLLVLIHAATGIRLVHVGRADARVADLDMVAGQFTAMMESVSQSLNLGPGQRLEDVNVGDVSVRVETGPHAMLLAVLRGPGADAGRERLRETLEEIHAEFGRALCEFNGDVAPFGAAANLLERCFVGTDQEARPQ